jgi:hypothetical protein
MNEDLRPEVVIAAVDQAFETPVDFYEPILQGEYVLYGKSRKFES